MCTHTNKNHLAAIPYLQEVHAAGREASAGQGVGLRAVGGKAVEDPAVGDAVVLPKTCRDDLGNEIVGDLEPMMSAGADEAKGEGVTSAWRATMSTALGTVEKGRGRERRRGRGATAAGGCTILHIGTREIHVPPPTPTTSFCRANLTNGTRHALCVWHKCHPMTPPGQSHQ